jgi:hypothetical protein
MRLLPCLLAFAVAVVSGRAAAQADKAAAEALFQQAKSLFEQKSYAEACPKFDASHKLEPSVGTVLFLGDCWEKLGKKASAWASFEEAAALAARENDGKRKNVAEVRAAALEPQITKLEIRVLDPVDGIVVRRNGVEIPRATWGTPLPVDAGSYALEATAPGKRSWTREVTVADGGETIAVDVPALEDVAPAAPPPAPPPPPEEPAVAPPVEEGGDTTGLLVAGAVIAAVGVAGVVVGSVFGGLAKSANDDSLEPERCRTETLCSDEGLALREDAKDRATIATATFIPGAVLFAVGITMVIVAAATDGPSGEQAKIELAVGPSHVDLRGSF